MRKGAQAIDPFDNTWPEKWEKTRTECISFTVPSNAECRGGFFLCDPQFFVLVCSLRRQFLVSSPVSFGQPLEFVDSFA